MARRAKHMLFDRAHRNTQLIGDIGVGMAIEAAKDEDDAGAIRQCLQQIDDCAQVLATLDNSGCIDIGVAMRSAVEGNVIVGMPHGSPTMAIAENAGRGLEYIGADIGDRIGRTPSGDPYEDLLGQVFKLTRIRMVSPEIMDQGSPKLESVS